MAIKRQSVRVRNLTEFGIISDIASFETPANAFTDGNNVSFEGGAITKAGVRYPALKPTPEAINKVYAKDRVVYGCSTKNIYRYTSQWEKISHKAYNGSTEWFITELSNVVVFCNIGDNPVYLDTKTKTIKELPGWGVENGQKAWRAGKIRSFKNYLIALDLVEEGVEMKQRIRWSDIASPNEPPPSWDASATGKNATSAGFNDLSEVKGAIIDAVSMNDYMLIYTTQEVVLMEYVGGNDIFRFRKVFEDLSMVSSECAVNVNGGHFVVTSNDVVIHQGAGSYTSIADGRIKQFLFREIGQGAANKVKVIAYPSKNEVWVMYPRRQSVGLYKAAVYNTKNNTWGFRDLPGITAIGYGVIPDGKERIIDTQKMTINSDGQIIDGIGKDLLKNSLYCVIEDRTCWVLDEGKVAQKYLPCSVVKRNMDFDDWGLDETSHKQINGIIPQFRGSGIVNISIGTSETAEEEPRWTTPVEFHIGKDRRANFRRTGRYISVKFETFGNDPWELYGYSIEVMETGDR